MNDENDLDDDDFFAGYVPSSYDENAWINTSVDFLDPLVQAITDWMRREPGVERSSADIADWIEEFAYIIHAIATGVGSQDATDRWGRAQVELAIEVSPDFKSDFETRVKDMFHNAYHVKDEVSKLCADDPHRWASSFAFCVDVDEFCRYLRNCSLTLQHRFANRATSQPVGHKEPSGDTCVSESYLGLCINEDRRTVARNVACAPFGRKDRAWQLFIALYRAREDGKSKKELLEEIWGETPVTENSLDQQKSTLNKLLEPLEVEAVANNRGIWRLADLPGR